MTRARCVLAAFVIAFAVLQPGAPAAQQYDARPDILRAKIREVGAGFVGYVKSATADTVTVTSDGSYSVIAKGEEYTFQITPNTTVSQMKEDGEFKPPQALQANELRAAQFVGVVEDTHSEATGTSRCRFILFQPRLPGDLRRVSPQRRLHRHPRLRTCRLQCSNAIGKGTRIGGVRESRSTAPNL